MLDRVRGAVLGIARRLAASYVLATVVVVVLVEAFVLGYQVPRVVSAARLHSAVTGTATSYLDQLIQRYPGGVPAGVVLGERDQPVAPGTARTELDGSVLAVPTITGKVNSDKAVTAVVAISQSGMIIASSAPSRYPRGDPVASELPAAATAAIRDGLAKGAPGGSGSTPYGTVSWTLYGVAGPNGAVDSETLGFLYVQAPQSTGFVNPISAWGELGQVSDMGAVYTAVLPLVILPILALLALLGSRRLVRRIRRLEEATVAVVDGDYTAALPTAGHDQLGRLETNVATMARQLSSALAAERERATSEARAAERSRIAREIHDAISQHLFGLRMIASGMRRADPHNEQVRAIEQIADDALRDMQALLWELRPPALDSSGLGHALEQVCTACRDRFGMTVDADLADLTLPEPVENALLRVAQEACTNAARHAQAERLSVSMARRDGHVELTVVDNGIGFDPASSHSGTGLEHIRARVTELGGTVRIDSAPGEGTAVTIMVPAP